MIDAARLVLMYLVLPLWIAAGFLDWCCHRRTGIERTGGWRESAFHLLMFAQMGVAGLMALLLEITPAVLVGMGLLFLLHEITVWVELRFVVGRRFVGPFEQMVHSVMEILPLAGLLILAVTHASPPDDGFMLKRAPLPVGYLVAAACAIVILNLAPLLEEAWRCLRHGRIARAG